MSAPQRRPHGLDADGAPHGEPHGAAAPRDGTVHGAHGEALPVPPRRFQQFISIGVVTCVLGIVSTLLEGDAVDAAVLAVTALLLPAALLLSHRGRQEAATAFGVAAVTLAAGYLLVRNQGVRDEAMVALPAILLVAGVFGSRRLFVVEFVAVIGLVSAIVAGNLQGWHANPPQPVGLNALLYLVVVLLANAACIWLVTGDLRTAWRSLHDENERLRGSHAQLRESHQRIDALAHYDALTGLPNRLLARDRFEQAVAMAQRSGHRAALIFLDLDDFKTVNDSQGHASGDLLLAQVAARLAALMRASDTVSRQGGDEFLILLGGLVDADAAGATALKIIEALAAPFQVGELEVSVTCSLGIALFPDDGTDFDTLLRNADMALYRAKDAGRNTYCFFEAHMRGEAVDALHLAAGLRSALARGEFCLHYQPQYELGSGRIVGAEALIRWRHPELGLISPARFVSIAERSGLINAIGAWVLMEACRQARAWQQAGLDSLVVSVNVSPVQFRRDRIEREVLDALEAAQLAPNFLELELTESLLIDEAGHLGPLLARLRQAGVRFCIDDFGTGYSNLGYLRRFEVERLKIDQSFVRHVTADANAEGIVRAIVEMAHILKLELVAEGIEDAATLARLVQMGCEFGQGFLWSRALPPDEFLEFYRRTGGRAA